MGKVAAASLFGGTISFGEREASAEKGVWLCSVQLCPWDTRARRYNPARTTRTSCSL